MFKAIAEFAMRGRIQAIVVALLGSWVPLLSQAVFGLVTLRRGWQEGLLVTFWASLPAFVGLWVGQVPIPMALASIAVFFVGYVTCCVLRQSISWPLTLMATVVLSTFSALLIVSVQEGVVGAVASFFETLLTGPEGQLSPEAKAFIDGWTKTGAGGLIAYWIGLSSVLGLLAARWWQALLYNPGGFQQEFHAMRLPLRIALVSAVAVVYCINAGKDYLFWSALFGMPLMLAGLGLAHCLIRRYKLGYPALIAMYIVLPLISVSALILMLLALLDAGLDLRNKLKIDRPE